MFKVGLMIGAWMWNIACQMLAPLYVNRGNRFSSRPFWNIVTILYPPRRNSLQPEHVLFEDKGG